MKESDIQKHLLISQVRRLGESPGATLDTPEDILEFIEAPLVPAITTLLGKGIRTMTSNANTQDGQSSAYFSIDLASLSEENRRVALEILGIEALEAGPWGDIHFNLPITPTTPIADVSIWAERLANRFMVQPATWEIRYSLDEVREWESEWSKMAADEIQTEVGLFLGDDGFFYRSESAYKRFKGLGDK